MDARNPWHSRIVRRSYRLSIRLDDFEIFRVRYHIVDAAGDGLRQLDRLERIDDRVNGKRRTYYRLKRAG